MHLDAAHPLLPIVSLAAGVFLLIAPRIVSFAVAVYLIIVGILGLNGIYHIFNNAVSAGPKPRGFDDRVLTGSLLANNLRWVLQLFGN